MIIDAHVHFSGEVHNIDGILKYLENNKLDKIVLCPGEPNIIKNRKIPMISNIIQSSNLGYISNNIICMAVKLSRVIENIDAQNDEIASISNSYPDKIMQAYWAQPLEDNCMEKLEKNYLKHNFHVIKIHQCWHNFDILHKKMQDIVNWSLTKQIPIFIHLLSKEQSIKFLDLTNKFLNGIFIVGHMIGFEDIFINSKNKNIYFDISAPHIIPFKTLKKAIKTIGSRRIVFGSDTPYGNNNIKINIRRIKKLGLNIEEEENILGNNFINLSHIK